MHYKQDKMKHIWRYGTHAESKYFLAELSDKYDAVIFNGNMVAYTPDAITGFVAKLNQKSFFIDPQTHAFQHDIAKLSQADDLGNLTPKLSFKKLADFFGNPVSQNVGKQSLLPEDFSTDIAKLNFCKNVINFQKDLIKERIEKQEVNKYMTFLQEKGLPTSSFEPYGLIAPYFLLTSNTYDYWISLNIEFAQIAKREFPDAKIFAQIVISKDLLLIPEKLEDIILRYGNLDCENIFLWIDNFDEGLVGKEYLISFLRLLKGLSVKGKKIYNLHGGFLSIILTSVIGGELLEGVCHGLEYGESRGVVPVGGGIPMAKYYFYPIHKRIRYTDFLTVFSQKGWNLKPEDFKTSVCDCAACDKLIALIQSKAKISKEFKYKKGNQIITLNYPTQEVKDLSLRHYLFSKAREYEEVSHKNKEEVKDTFLAAFENYKSTLGLEEVVHLLAWKEIIL